MITPNVVAFEPSLKRYNYALREGDWTLAVFYKLTDWAVAVVDIQQIALCRGNVMVPLPLGMPSPQMWAEIEARIMSNERRR